MTAIMTTTWDLGADGRFRPDDPCELHNWYGAVADLTFRSSWFAVSAEEAQAIIALNQARRQIGWLRWRGREASAVAEHADGQQLQVLPERAKLQAHRGPAEGHVHCRGAKAEKG